KSHHHSRTASQHRARAGSHTISLSGDSVYVLGALLCAPSIQNPATHSPLSQGAQNPQNPNARESREGAQRKNATSARSVCSGAVVVKVYGIYKVKPRCIRNAMNESCSSACVC